MQRYRSTLTRSRSTDDNRSNDSDTIFALSSGASSQATALAVIRLSGPHAANALQQMTSAPLPKPRMAALRKIYHPWTKEPLDQALVLYFPSPNSFTGEDVVELHCHGSRAVVADILEALPIVDTSSLLRLAEPGEFTQRAWMAGKLDLLQVEALADLLQSDTQKQRQQALQQLDGQLSNIYQQWRTELIAGLAHAEAVIDFGDDEHLLGLDEEDEDDVAAQANIWGGVRDNMYNLRQSMTRQLQDARRGELVREGLNLAIVGPPNSGKSSLYNLLSQRDAAIVSSTAGTTRDILEIQLNLGGVKCILQDTAGVRTSTDDVIELEGIKRAQAAASMADLVIAMVDSTDTSAGLEILEETLTENSELDPEKVLLVLNKSDLQDGNIDIPEITSKMIGGQFSISCTTQDGVEAFLGSLTKKVVARVTNVDDTDESFHEGALITRARHRQHVQAALEALERFEQMSQQGTMAVDMAAEELRLAASELGRITGAVDVEDVLDKLFTDFCIGK